MCQTNSDGYTNVMYNPNRHDTYLVYTVEKTYDFAFFDGNGWTKGKIADGTPLFWREIPKCEDLRDLIK